MSDLNLRLLNGSETNDFVLKFRTLCAPDQFNDSVLKTLAEQVEELHNKFAQGFERESKDPLTEELANADMQRDRLFNGFKGYVSSLQNSDNSDKATAANKIEKLIRKHGWDAYKMSYSEETTAITNLLKELLDDYSAEVEILNAAEWINPLDAAQKLFDKLQINRIEKGAEDVPTLSKYRQVLTQAIKRMITTLESFVLATEDAHLIGILRKVNELVDTTMTIAHANATRKKNQKIVSGDFDDAQD